MKDRTFDVISWGIIGIGLIWMVVIKVIFGDLHNLKGALLLLPTIILWVTVILAAFNHYLDRL